MTVAALIDARIGALARQLRVASLPAECERLAALLSALQAARDARHTLNRRCLFQDYPHAHTDAPSEAAVPGPDKGGAHDPAPRSDLPLR